MIVGAASQRSSLLRSGCNECSLGEVIELISGQHINAGDYNSAGKGLPYLTGPSDFGDQHPRITRWTEFPKKSALKGDILLTVKGSGVGKMNILDVDEAVISRQLMALRAKGIDERYLALIVAAHGDYFRSLATGAAIPGISREDVTSLRVSVPPIEEQERIVAVLDQAFAALGRARAHAEANLADAQDFFLSALRSIFSNSSRKWSANGRLQSVTSAEPSITGKRSKAATQTGGRDATTRPIEGDYSLSVLMPNAKARQGWIWSPLSTLARLESGHTPSRKHPEYWGGDIGWMGIKDARDHHGGVITRTREQTNALGIKNSSARVLPKGTVCLSRTASVGYVVTMGADMATSQDFVNWICGPHLEPDFLKFLLLAQGDDIRKFASGSVHQTIYFPEVKAFHICHPAVEVQKEICRFLEVIREEAVRMGDAYRAKLADLANLRQSLLQKAFSGELT